MNICSLLPGATEVVAALGLADQLVGISHECDYPPELSAPVMVEPLLSMEGLSSADIDHEVRAVASANQSLYRLRDTTLAGAKPDLIILQDLCDVCAVTPVQLTRAMPTLSPPPRLLILGPATLEDCLNDIERIGSAVGRFAEAHQLADDLRRRLAEIRRRVNGLPKPRVACVEWLSPLYIAGHWVPDMVEAAGGQSVLSHSGTKSRRITWEELAAEAPDAVVIMPCGYTKEQATREWQEAIMRPEWRALPAVEAGRFHVVDAQSYFSRPGPRLIEGVSQLASFLHPHIPSWGSSLHEAETSPTYRSSS